MAFHLRPLQASECCSCLRRLAATGPTETWTARPFQQQIRGKKKLAKDKDDRLKVRLLKDIPKYGRKGSIVPLPRGMMRNLWYPLGKAEYVTDAQLRELDLKNTTIERDITFRPNQRPGQAPREEKELPKEEQVDIKVRVKLLTAERATEILSAVIPSSIIFYRSSIAAISQQKKSLSRPAASSSAAADLAAAYEPLPKPEPIGIYGSVSTTDIATSIRALLATHEEGSRVVISAEDISFVGEVKGAETGEADRVKHLGDFEVEIKLTGASQSLQRTVRILAEEKNTNEAQDSVGQKE